MMMNTIKVTDKRKILLQTMCNIYIYIYGDFLSSLYVEIPRAMNVQPTDVKRTTSIASLVCVFVCKFCSLMLCDCFSTNERDVHFDAGAGVQI